MPPALASSARAMASFLHANLPSEDEEDQDFVPDEKDEGAKRKKAKRVRGAAMGAQPGGDDEDDHAQAGPSSAVDQELEDARPDPKREAKKAKVDALWQQLNARQPARAAPQATSLSQLCRPASQLRKGAEDNAWMRQLGLSAPRPKPGAAGNAIAAAAAALAAAKQAASSTTAAQHGTVTLQETRRFAGKEVTVAREVATGSKEATKAAAEAESAAKKKAGLDAVLASLEHAKKVTVLDKSRADWGQYKKADETVQEELQTHGRSADQYLERQAFLKSAELRQYEQERDARLGSDIRNRGRL